MTGGKMSAKTIVSSILEDVKTFSAGAQQSDDITILALKFYGEPK